MRYAEEVRESLLYVIYGSDKIKMPEVAKTRAAGNLQADAFYSGTISISDIVREVKDEDLLEYLPDGLLTSEQLLTKREAIAKQVKYTNDKNDRKYKEFIQKGDIASQQDEISVIPSPTPCPIARCCWRRQITQILARILSIVS